MHPPPATDFSDRDFTQAHRAGGPSRTYYGRVYKSAFGADPFFTVSRRLELDGKFVGVIEVSVLLPIATHSCAANSAGNGRVESFTTRDHAELVQAREARTERGLVEYRPDRRAEAVRISMK